MQSQFFQKKSTCNYYLNIYLKGLPEICPKQSKTGETFNGEFWQNFQACISKISLTKFMLFNQIITAKRRTLVIQ